MLDLQELLPLYALDALSAEEARLVEAELSRQPHLVQELEAFRAASTQLLGHVAPVQPSPHVLQRLMGSVGAGRFERFTARFAQIFDVSVAAGRELLAWIEDPTKWEDMNPLAQVIHFPAGPACAGADTGFVRVAPGGTFPYHGHGGDEITLVLAGSARTSDGKILRIGDETTEDPGSAHDLENIGDEDFIYASRVYGVDYSIPKPQK
ncbi:MAG: cupin domain-containing protein [Kofleriaceae bacterium]